MHLRHHPSPQALPVAWREILEADASIWWQLGTDDRTRLEELTMRFAATKQFEPAGGLELDDRVIVVIAAHAAVPALRLGLEAYRDVHSVIVYPSTVVRSGVQAVSRAGGICHSGATPLLGETLQHGPVLVVWDAAVHAAHHPEQGRNVVYHEFAHKLDMLGGSADGVPPQPDLAAARRWEEMIDEQLERIRNGPVADPVLGSYAEVSGAELFAVATEAFFTIPHPLRDRHEVLYDALAGFYRQDPAGWERRPVHSG
jgi:Mlc titration factor MtfA (ptsG expression regulator)